MNNNNNNNKAMHNWSQMMQLPGSNQRQVWTFYEQANCPMEVRIELTQWFEQQNWLDINRQLEGGSSTTTSVNNCVPSTLEVNLYEVVSSLAMLVDNRLQNAPIFPARFKWTNFRERLSADNLGILRTLNECVKFEMSIVQSCLDGDAQHQADLDRLFAQASQDFAEAGQLYQSMEAIVSDVNVLQQPYEDVAYDNQLYNLVAQYRDKKESLIFKQQQVLSVLEQLHDGEVGKMLAAWKKTPNLNHVAPVKQSCESLAQGFFNLLGQLKCIETMIRNFRFEAHSSELRFTNTKATVVDRLRRLINDSFVIVEQPKQWLKKQNKFQASVYLLIANVVNVNLCLPLVTVEIINEQTVRQLLQNPLAECVGTLANSGRLTNNKCHLAFDSVTRHLWANFPKLLLNEIQRGPAVDRKKEQKKVVNEKAALLFTTELAIAEDVPVKVKVFSRPVVMMVHGVQEKDAIATIRWDNAFAHRDRIPFEVPTEVRFADLAAKILSPMFYEIGERHLTAENIRFLACKLLGRYDLVDASNEPVTWTMFCKDPMPPTTANGFAGTFWDWFYETWKLTRDHLACLWKSDYILGFVPKDKAEALLQSSEPGTFLLRFSESIPGAICITALVERDGGRTIYMVTPMVGKELHSLSLPDMLHSYAELKRLYPDRNKDEVMSHLYSRPKKPANGYVNRTSKFYLPDSSNCAC